MTFGSFPRSRGASLVLAMPPSVLAAGLPERDAAGQGPPRVPASPGPACHSHRQPGVFEFGARKARPQLQRAKETSPSQTSFLQHRETLVKAIKEDHKVIN